MNSCPVSKRNPGPKAKRTRTPSILAFPDFASALAFVVRLGCLAEKKDHHPDIELGWGKVRVLWTTHDAGGLTRLDLEMAEAADALKS